VCRFHVAAGEKLYADKLSGAIVRSVAKLAGINLRKFGSFSYWFDNLGFTTEGKTCCCAHHNLLLGFSNKFSSVNYTLARQQSVPFDERKLMDLMFNKVHMDHNLFGMSHRWEIIQQACNKWHGIQQEVMDQQESGTSIERSSKSRPFSRRLAFAFVLIMLCCSYVIVVDAQYVQNVS
jgi:hypothetical protein